MDKNDIHIAIHHHTLHLFADALDRMQYMPGAHNLPLMVYGVPVKYDCDLIPYSTTPPKWQFPQDEPFVTYEPSDESWCRYCRIGSEIPAKLTIGDIKIRRDLPVRVLPAHSRSVMFHSLDPSVDRVGYSTMEDSDYAGACRAVEYIDKTVRRHLKDQAWKQHGVSL